MLVDGVPANAEFGRTVGKPHEGAVAALMVKKGVFLVPTSAAQSADYESASPAQRVAMEPTMQALRAEIANARAEHVRIASGFDAATEDKQGRNALELASLVKLGLTPIEAIRAATTTAAELMGWQDSVGSIEKNRFADLIAGDGDPLGRHLDSAACLLVIKGGKQVKPVVPD